jgi:tRNA dimethylallyltransferase
LDFGFYLIFGALTLWILTFEIICLRGNRVIPVKAKINDFQLKHKRRNLNNPMPQNIVIVIIGPTGVGKTKVALALARKLATEIIHADSRQVYRYMDICTAKPGLAERRQVKHHLIDVVDPDQYFSAGRYRQLALQAIDDLITRGKTPLVEGGSGLYIRALVDGLFPGPGADKTYRRQLRELASQRGSDYLYRELKRVDPISATRLHSNDEVRIIRALEIYHNTGQSASHWYNQPMPASGYNFKLYGLNCPRPQLYEQIDRRVDNMLEEGLLEEVKRLLEMGYHRELTSMQSLGYRHMLAYLQGDYDLDQAVDLMKRDSRRYAKRQLTWFRRDRRIRWFDFSPGMDPAVMADKIWLDLRQDLLDDSN